MKAKVLSCILCVALIFSSMPSGITVNASENIVETIDFSEVETEDSIATAETISSGEGETENGTSEVISETNVETTETVDVGMTETITEVEEETGEGETEEIVEETTEVITELETQESEIDETLTAETETEETETEIETDEDIMLLNDDGNIASGSYNDVTWVIDADGKLTVSGTGNFRSWHYENVPWYDYRDEIKSAVVNLTGTTDSSSMFYGCEYLTSVDLSGFDTSNVTDMSYMFRDCGNLAQLNLENFDTSNVTDMTGMFNNCSSLKELDLSNFDTHNVTSMCSEYSFQSIFGKCKFLEELKLGENFVTDKVTDMSGMFYNCINLKSIDLSGFNTSNVKTMKEMFYNCSSLTSLDLSSFDTSKVKDMYYMFSGCSSLNNLNLSSFDTSKVNTMQATFWNCSSLTELDLSGFDTSNVTEMEYLFDGCKSLEKLDLSSFKTSKVTSLNAMFFNCNKLEKVNLSSFDMSNVTDITYMFYGCNSLVELDLSNFNLAKVKDASMFLQGFVNNKLNKIYTPTNLKISVSLPYGGVWYMPDGTEITELPQNLDYSIVIERNNIPQSSPEPTPEIKVTVSFNSNGGSEVESQIVTSGKKAKTPESPTKKDYTFAGWFEDEELTIPYGFDTAVTEDITLYAKWDEVTAKLKCRFGVTDTYAKDTGFTYTGSAITPEIVVTYKGMVLTKDTDYTVTYKNNINAASYSIGNKAPTVTVKGKGNYSGTWTSTFTINRVDLTSSDVKCASSISVVKGQKISKVTVTYNGKTLGTKDYKLTYDGEHANGKYNTSGKIYLVGIGNFKTENDSPRQIVVNVVANKKNLQTFKVDIKTATKPYTGSEIELTSNDYKITNKSTGNEISNCFIVTYSNNIKVGTAKVTFTGTGIYYGCTATKTFKITAPNSEMTIDDINESVSYNPSGATLGSKLVVRFDGSKLRENVDYKVTYKNNKKSGTASYSITFIGYYKGFKALTDKSQTFTISKPSLGDTDNVNAVSVDKIVKNQGAYKSAPIVTYMGTKVAANEYKVKYYIDGEEITANKISVSDVSTVTVKIESTGKTYASDGEHEVCTYNVWNSASIDNVSLNIANAKKVNISKDKTKMAYTGSEVTLEAGKDITITRKDGTIIQGDDFTKNFDVLYYNNIKVGKATIVIKAKPDSGYIGCKTATFTITKQDIK